jgi:hypothetical protein
VTVSETYCGTCGAQTTGGAFCQSCGAPTAPAAAPDAAAQPDPRPIPQPAHDPAPEPTRVDPVAQQPAPGATANPFAGLAAADLVRDVAALFLLFGALSLPWDATHQASGRWFVVIATVISALSLAVPYVVAMDVVPGWGRPQVRLVKLAAAVPYLLCVFVVLINELIHLSDDFEGGIGGGLTVGLAGVLLAAQSRAIDDDPTGASDALWRTVSVGLIGVGVVATTVSSLIYFVTNVGDTSSFGDQNGTLLLVGVLVLVIASYVVVVGLPLFGLLSGARESARVLTTVGFVIAAVLFLDGADDSPDAVFSTGLFFVEKLKDVIGPFLVVAGTSLLVSRPAQRAMSALGPVTSWVKTAQNACVVLGAGLGAAALGRLVLLLGAGDVESGAVVQLILTVLAAAAGLVAAQLLGGDARQARPVVVAIMGATILVGIVSITVARSGDASGVLVPAEVVGWFAMPGVALYALLIPEPVRNAFPPLAGQGPPTPRV